MVAVAVGVAADDLPLDTASCAAIADALVYVDGTFALDWASVDR